MLGVLRAAYPLRLTSVCGYEGRSNDVVYCFPASQGKNDSVVVFFGGDVQDFIENMQSHRDNKNYLKWNLENTARIIQYGFSESHIIVIRPSRMEYKTFSCFDNFVPSGNCGAPDHTPNHNALQHLDMLLKSISQRLSEMSKDEVISIMNMSKPALIETDKVFQEFTSSDESPKEENDIVINSKDDILIDIDHWLGKKIQLGSLDVKLVGFSKGCVVLNQFLYEFHYLKTLTPDDTINMGIVSRIRDMYWLDGGHSGGKNTWITSRPLLETLTRLGITVHIHVTPYQINDDRRPWIKREEKSFYELLCQLKASVERTVHFPNILPSLNVHFNILNAFQQNSSSKSSP